MLTICCISAVEGPHLGHLQAWCLHDTELFSYALVFSSSKRGRSAQRGKPSTSKEGLHVFHMTFCVIFCKSNFWSSPHFTDGPWGSATVQNADEHNGRKGWSFGSWWFPGRTDLQGITTYKVCRSFCHCLCVAHGFVFEQYVDQPGVAFCTNLAEDEDSITNAVDVYESPK